MEQQEFFQEDQAPSGLVYFKNFISSEEEKAFIEFFHSLSFGRIEMFGVRSKRRIAEYGVHYSFTSFSLTKAPPPPKIFHPLIIKVSRILKVDPDEIGEVLISHYPVGAPIGWHRDAAPFKDVFGVSLGGSCVLKFRKLFSPKSVHYDLFLPPRSAYCLRDEVRWRWQHRIPPLKEERYSITLRTLKTD
jgi:alkylated DNA repair dioxygenase AlkB